MAFFNELCVSLYLYLMICLTDFQGENPFRDALSYSVLGLVILTVSANLLKAMWFDAQILKDWVRKKLRERRA
jgi:hypothetical protein